MNPKVLKKMANKPRGDICVVKHEMKGLDESRDGRGGGFNERQGRASSKKVSVDDDGYDDFGRKISSNKQSKAEKQAAALARLQAL